MAKIERTLAMIKPGEMHRARSMAIAAYMDAGLLLVRNQLVLFSVRLAEELYRDHAGKEFFSRLVAYMTAGSCHAFIVEGPDAIAKVRQINGATDPRRADPFSIRGLLAEHFNPDCPAANFVHGSDSPEAAEREIRLIFGEDAE